MKKVRKIKEIKPKAKIIKEIEKEETEIMEDVAKAEESFRNEVSTITGIKAPILEAEIAGSENTEIQEATREMSRLDRENKEREIQYGRRDEAETRSTYNANTQQYMLAEQNVNILPERTATMQKRIEHEAIQPKRIDSSEERAERYRTREEQKRKRRYPWEI